MSAGSIHSFAPVASLVENATRFLFFTGKGGVGKTSLACGTAIALADQGKRVLLVSTDPASNLDEILATSLGKVPRQIEGVDRLDAMNIDPMVAARDYRERILAPIRDGLPEAVVRSIEEQLSGACTTEIASFNEFARLLGDAAAVADYDHIVMDTAPTGHTLRLLALPAAWTEFIDGNKLGSTCLGPLSGLTEQRALYTEAIKTLADGSATAIVLVARADGSSLDEADRARVELEALGISNHCLVVNGYFPRLSAVEEFAAKLSKSQAAAVAEMPVGLLGLRCMGSAYRIPLGSGIDQIRNLFLVDPPTGASAVEAETSNNFEGLEGLDSLIETIARSRRGLVMTMGKGGVGKTTVAKRLALALARRGHRTHLTTTDPAEDVLDLDLTGVPLLTVNAIDPQAATERHVARVLADSGLGLDNQARALLEEELRSPCVEEVAVFLAFAEEVAKGADRFVVLDTAPTGHTLLLLDASEGFHREISKDGVVQPEAVRELLPRLRDPEFTRILLVTLPESTPVHEAARLQDDLRRAGIEPFAWIINRCIGLTPTRDPLLLAKGEDEFRNIREVVECHAARVVVEAWRAD